MQHKESSNRQRLADNVDTFRRRLQLAPKLFILEVLLAAVILVLAGLTVRDVLATAVDYASERTVTRITVVSGSMLEINALTMCMPFDDHQWASEFDAHLSKNITGLLNSNSPSDNLILTLIGIQLLNRVSEFENGVRSCVSDSCWGNEASNIKELLRLKYDRFEDFLAFLDESIRKIIGVSAFCTMVNPQTMLYEDTDIRFKLSWLGKRPLAAGGDNTLTQKLFCLRLADNEAFRLRYADDSCTIRMQPERLLGHAASGLWIQLSNDGVISIADQTFGFYPSISDQWSVGVQLLGKYRAYSSTKKPCSEDAETKLVCRMRCRREFFESRCDCTLLSTMFMFGNESTVKNGLCVPDSNAMIEKNTSDNGFVWKVTGCQAPIMVPVSDPNPQCVEEACVPSCEVKTYAFQIGAYQSQGTINGSALYLYTIASSFQVSDEFPAMSSLDLIASLGGCLALWLELGFLTAVKFIHRIGKWFWSPKVMGGTLEMSTETELSHEITEK